MTSTSVQLRVVQKNMSSAARSSIVATDDEHHHPSLQRLLESSQRKQGLKDMELSIPKRLHLWISFNIKRD
jgi:hypothetical protein